MRVGEHLQGGDDTILRVCWDLPFKSEHVRVGNGDPGESRIQETPTTYFGPRWRDLGLRRASRGSGTSTAAGSSNDSRTTRSSAPPPNPTSHRPPFRVKQEFSVDFLIFSRLAWSVFHVGKLDIFRSTRRCSAASSGASAPRSVAESTSTSSSASSTTSSTHGHTCLRM